MADPVFSSLRRVRWRRKATKRRRFANADLAAKSGESRRRGIGLTFRSEDSRGGGDNAIARIG
jgi:hypothetical protein